MIRDTYQTEYRVSLERDLSVKVEGLFGRMLMQLLMRNKNLDSDVDVELADREVEALFAVHIFLFNINNLFKLMTIIANTSKKIFKIFFKNFRNY